MATIQPAKTPLILALTADNAKTSLVIHTFYHQIVISMIKCNFLQSLQKHCKTMLIFEKSKVALNPLLSFVKLVRVTFIPS